MEKNKLDKLFQDKFAEREFEFQNSYWEEAEALIEAAERGRRKQIILWVFGILLVIASAAFGWYLAKTETPPIAKSHNFENIEDIKTDEQNTPKSAIEEYNFSEKMEAATEKKSPSENDILQKGEDQSISEKKVTENAANFQEILSKKSNIKTAKLNKFSNGNSTNELEESNLINHSTYSKTGNYDKNESLQFENKRELLLQKLLVLENEIEKKEVANLALKKPIEKAVAEAITSGQFETKTKLRNAKEIKFLTNEFSLLHWKTKLRRNVSNSIFEESKNPPKSHRWQLTATAGLSVLPNPKSNDKSVANIFGGLMFGYKITPNLLLQTGLTYQITQVDSILSESSQQTSYGFGKHDDLINLQTDQLHFLEMPVLVGYQVEKMRFSAGLKIGKLLAARGKAQLAESKFPFERTDEENADFNLRLIQVRDSGEEKPVFRTEDNGENGWLATDNFKAWQFSLVGKYQFQVTPKFDLGIGVAYRLNRHYLKNEASNHSPLTFQFFTTYRIFN